MAEISYPFNADNANGGSRLVGQVQWQEMAHMWGGDRVDFRLTNATYTAGALPFASSVITGHTARINAGNAWVGGFYYKLTAAMDVPIPSNSSSLGRRDLIVIRADLAKSAVNLAVKTGTPAASPITPPLTRQNGGIWEMPLYEVTSPANDASISLTAVMPFDMPPKVAVPWNADQTARLSPAGTFLYDMDVNSSGGQCEYYNGQAGYAVSRDLAKTRTYTPSILNGAAPASVLRSGRYRYIAPGVIWFQAQIQNPTKSNVNVSSNQWRLGISLPVAAGPRYQVIHGYVSNGNQSAGLPNMIALTGLTAVNSTALWLHMPNDRTVGEGLDGLRAFPAGANTFVSGTIETIETVFKD